MNWYEGPCTFQGGEGRIVATWENNGVAFYLETDTEQVPLYHKKYAAFVRETPSEEELQNRFGAKLVKVIRMLTELDLNQIKRKNWQF